MLTGNALKEFAKWYNEFLLKNDYTYNEFPIPFLALPFSMQSGVITDFLDSKGIFIHVGYDEDGGWFYQINDNDRLYHFTDRNTALTHAITKACEIYNEVKNDNA